MEMENVNKSQTDISKLPDDVLLEIFGYLHGNKDKRKSDLVNATLVCKKWNRIITEEPRLMDKLLLKANFFELLGYKFIHQDYKLTRPYRHAFFAFSIHISFNQSQSKRFNEVLNQMALLKNLTSVALFSMELTPKLIDFLSHFKFLQVLVFDDCSYQNQLDYDDEVEQFYFDNLRQLKFTGGEAMRQTEVLQHLKCKELDSFVKEPSYTMSRPRASSVIHFLNDLDRCDQIEVDDDKWHFGYEGYDSIPLTPKFTWSKLNLSYSLANLRPEILFIEALCKASKPNAESEIVLCDINDREENRENLWKAVLNNCKTLTLLNSYVPSNLTNLRPFPELHKLMVNAKTMKHENFFQLASKLTGVSHLEIHQFENQKFKLSAESALQLQEFFDRLIELTLPKCYLSLQENESQVVNDLLPLLDIEFKNLTTLTVKDVQSDSLDNDHYDEKFFNFCTQTQSLKHLNIEVDVWNKSTSPNFQQIKWYQKLYGTSAIQTCNILTENDDCQPPTLTNWREGEFDEVKLFGRMLTDDENRFFI